MSGGKKKNVKLSLQEVHAQFGTVSRNPLDNLPTSSRGYSDNPRESYRQMYAERERHEDRDEGPSRADEATAWRSSKSVMGSARGGGGFEARGGGGFEVRGGGGFEDRSRDFGRSDDGAWRSSRPMPSASSLSGGFSRSDEPDTTGRPRLQLVKPSAERLQAAQEHKKQANIASIEEKKSTGSPFGDAKPVEKRDLITSAAATVSKPSPFGDATPRPVGKPSPSGDATAKPIAAAKPVTKPNPFGDAVAKPIGMSNPDAAAKPVSKPNPFGAAKPVEKPYPLGTAKAVDPAEKPTERFTKPPEAALPRFARPSDTDYQSTSRRTASVEEASSRFSRPIDQSSETASASSRFSRLIDQPPVRQPRAPEPVTKLAPSLPPKRTPAAAAPTALFDERPKLSPKPVEKPKSEPPTAVRSALTIAMSEGTWVSADELADSIALLSLESDKDVESLGNVIALSLAEKTLLFPSALSLLKDRKRDVVRSTLCQLVKSVPADLLESIVGGVDIVSELGISSSLKREEIISQLKKLGLEQFAPTEDVTSIFKALCEKQPSDETLLFELKSTFPKKSKILPEVVDVISQYIISSSLSSTFDQAVLEANMPLFNYMNATVDLQAHILFGAQAAWFSKGTGIKRSGRLIFQGLHEMRVVTVDSLVAWMHDKDRVNGKRPLLLQCGGYISDQQNSAIAHQLVEHSDSEDSVDLDNDFPQANRNYDDY